MAMNVRECVFCGLDLDRMCRSNQLFCDERCRQRARRLRIKQQAQTAQKVLPSRRPAPPQRAQTPSSQQAPQPPRTQHADAAAQAPSTHPTNPASTSRSRWWQEGLRSFASLEEEMRKIPEAVSYRLVRAIKYNLRPIFFPERGKPLTRLDGRVSDEPFRLRPEFEPPLVPEAGLYGVQLLDANGQEVKLPRSLYRGATLPKWPPEMAAEPPERGGPATPAAASSPTETRN